MMVEKIHINSEDLLNKLRNEYCTTCMCFVCTNEECTKKVECDENSLNMDASCCVKTCSNLLYPDVKEAKAI
jgi:hypothetical protein